MTNNPTNNIYYVYKHTFSNGVCYIGKGKGNRAYRFNDRNHFWNNCFSKYGEPYVNIVNDDMSEKEAFSFETIMISLYKKKNIRICNLTDGGEGTSGRVTTIEQKNKTSASMVGVAHTDERKRNISLSKIGKKRSIEHHNNILKAQTGLFHPRVGKKHSDEAKLKMSFKRQNNTPINFYHNDFGNVICPSNELLKKYNLSKSSLWRLTKGLQKSYQGWSIIK